eukprot:8831302-Pyramimonas_sp.AAC.1
MVILDSNEALENNDICATFNIESSFHVPLTRPSKRRMSRCNTSATCLTTVTVQFGIQPKNQTASLKLENSALKYLFALRGSQYSAVTLAGRIEVN